MSSRKLFLKGLTLKNFATFENQEIDYTNNFNAIIGETGSGKSLILDSLQLILGAKADKRIIRKDAEFAIIEASFKSDDKDIKVFFDKLDLPFDGDEIVIKRIIYQNGKSKSYINHQAANNQTLSLFSKRFIDLVGQFENQKLMSEDYQLILLDSFCNNQELLKDYQTAYSEVQTKKAQLDEMTSQQEKLREREDYLQFQINEFDKLSPDVKDELELINKKDALLNVEKIKTSVSGGQNLLSDADINVIDMLKRAISVLEKDNIQNLNNHASKLRDALQNIEDVSYDLSNMSDDEFSEDSVEEIMDRLDLYQKLKRKFSCDTEQLIVLYEKFSEELSSLSSFEERITKLQKQIKEGMALLTQKADALHIKRLDGAKRLSTELTSKVRLLKMEGATLVFQIEKSEIGPRGNSKINFISETNKGEGFFKVKEIASGGELSRILLALRQILSSEDSISVFLFDEIDTGIGGETAMCIGKALADVAKHSQVIAITHLPQIASFADRLIVVNKQIVDESRTVSIAKEISGKEARKFVESMAALH